jgi:hypothetical protein
MSRLTGRRSKLKSSDAGSHGRVRPIGRSALLQRDLPGDPRPLLPGTAGEKSADEPFSIFAHDVNSSMQGFR